MMNIILNQFLQSNVPSLKCFYHDSEEQKFINSISSRSSYVNIEWRMHYFIQKMFS